MDPKVDTQAKITFPEFRWNGPYKVEKVLPKNNYIVRRLRINKTQLLVIIQLRRPTVTAPLAKNFVREADWQKDDHITVTHEDCMLTLGLQILAQTHMIMSVQDDVEA